VYGEPIDLTDMAEPEIVQTIGQTLRRMFDEARNGSASGNGQGNSHVCKSR
jgi:hypothetical protein